MTDFPPVLAAGASAWLLTTRGRPDMARRLIDACVRTDMTHAGIMFVDGDSDLYDFPLPDNWSRIVSDNIGIGAAMDWYFRVHPELPFYGWLADDFVPKSRGWDVELAGTAADRFIAYCNDEWRRQDVPTWITSALAIGGDLVRAVGWFSAPGLRQAGLDSAWNFLGREFGLMRYRHDVVVEHVHWKNGKRARDRTDNRPEEEQQAWEAHIHGQRHRDARDAIRRFLATPAG